MARQVAVLLALAASITVPARADEVLGVLAVAEPPGPAPALAAATEQLRTALAAAGPGVLAAAELRARMVPVPPRASLDELRRAHAGAVAAYAAGEFESSLRTLRTVADGLEDLPDDPAVFAEWTATMLRLARTEQELGRRVEAQLVLERLLRAAPDARPDARRYPPSFLSLVEDARERLRAHGTRRLAVEAEAGARVFVDGREVGTAPVTLSLAPGRHRVGAERGGVRAAPALVDLAEEDRTVQLDLAYAEALRPDAGPGLALAAADQPLRVITIAARLGLDRVVMAALRRDGEATLLVGTLHDVRRGRAEREGWVRLEGGAPAPGAVDALAAFLATGRASALVTTPLGPSLVLKAAPPAAAPAALTAAPAALAAAPAARPSRARLYGWSAVIAGVATVACAWTAVDFGRAATNRYASARSMLDATGYVRPGQSLEQYRALLREGDDRRAIALQAGIAAGVGLVATGTLAWLWHGEVGDGKLHF